MTLEEILPSLLSRKWLERKKADLLLLEHFTQDDRESDPHVIEPWPERYQAAIRQLEPDPATFLSALIAFWADQCADEFTLRMAQFEKGPSPPLDRSGWASLHAARFPLDDKPRRRDFDMYGLWIGRLLSRIGPIATPCVPQLIACLRHPEPTVSGSAIGALGSIGPEARAALPALVERATGGELGADRITLPRAIARIAGDSLELAAHLSTRLRDTESEQVTRGACAVLRETKPGRRTGLDVAVAAFPHAKSAERRADLLWSATDWAEREGVRGTEVLTLAGTARMDPSERVRAAAAWCQGRLGDVRDEESLMQYANDEHPWVRGALAQALIGRAPPSERVVQRIAKNLGDYNGYDGSPHDDAVEVLRHWGPAAHVARHEMVEWLRSIVTKGYHQEQETVNDACRLAEGVGAFEGLFPAMRAILDAIEAQAPEPEIDLSQPGSLQAMEDRLVTSALQAGSSEQEARANAAFNAEMARLFMEAVPDMQAEIDAREAEDRADREAMFGKQEEVVDEHAEVEQAEDVEPDHIVRLRQVVRSLSDRA